jgi:hypothetical protein
MSNTMDYKFKLYKLMALSDDVKNKEKIYKDIEETILKIPDFTEPYFDMFLICDQPFPLGYAIIHKYDIELVRLLYKHYHVKHTNYRFFHSCGFCPRYSDGIMVKGTLDFLIKTRYHACEDYIKPIAKEFNVEIIEDLDEWHQLILNHVCN